MPDTPQEIEARIQLAIYHLEKNPNAKRAKIARQFDVSLQRLRSRLNGAPPASDVRGLHGRRLSPDQDLALIIYLRRMISLGLHPRLHMIESTGNKLLRQEDPTALPLSHAWITR
jgi:hypothetical protein